VSDIGLLLGGDAGTFLAKGFDRRLVLLSCFGRFSTGVLPSLPSVKLSRLPSLGSSDIWLFWLSGRSMLSGYAGFCSR
jgi:hypothetical protein